MGDFRFLFKAEFEMGSVKDKCDMWLNWSALDETGTYPIDHRVIEWLRKNFEAGVDDIRETLYAAREEQRRDEEVEEEDRILALADEIRERRKHLSQIEERSDEVEAEH